MQRFSEWLYNNNPGASSVAQNIADDMFKKFSPDQQALAKDVISQLRIEQMPKQPSKYIGMRNDPDRGIWHNAAIQILTRLNKINNIDVAALAMYLSYVNKISWDKKQQPQRQLTMQPNF